MKVLLLLSFLTICISSGSQKLVPYRYNNLFGYADTTGKITITPQFEEVNWFNENGLAAVKQNGNWGWINTEGEIVITPQFAAVFSFNEGLAAVCKGGKLNWIQGEMVGGEWGYINEKGEEVIPCKFHRAEHFYNGYAIVQTPGDNWGNWGVIDKTGKLILDYQYPTYSFDMRPFPGLKWDSREKGKLLYRPGQWDENWKQIDMKGKLTGKKVNDIHGEYPNEENDEKKPGPSLVKFTENGLTGFKDLDGKMVIAAKYPYASEFENGYALVDMNPTQYKIPDEGYINEKGVEFFKSDPQIRLTKLSLSNFFISNEYDVKLKANLTYAYELGNNYIAYWENELIKVMNKKGETVKTPSCAFFIAGPPTGAGTDPDSAHREVKAYLGGRNDSIFIFDENFTLRISMVTENLNLTSDLFAKTQLFIRENKICDIQGASISDHAFHELLDNDKIVVRNNEGFFSLIDNTGKILIPLARQNISQQDDLIYLYIYGKTEKENQIVVYDQNMNRLNQQKLVTFSKSYSHPELFLSTNAAKKMGYYIRGVYKEPVYDEVRAVTLHHELFILVVENGKAKFNDINGNPANNEVYEYVQPLLTDAVVKTGGKYGILTANNGKPEYMIRPVYDSIPVINYRLPDIIAVSKGGKHFYIDQKEKGVIDLELDFVSQFDDQSFAIAGKNNLKGIINRNGEWIVQPLHEKMEYYSAYGSNIVFYGFKNQQPVLYNYEGKSILPQGIDKLDFDYLEDGNYITYFADGKKGVLNFNGKIIVPALYDEIRMYYVDADDFHVYFSLKKDKGYGFADTSGKEISRMDYDKPEMSDDVYISAQLNLIPVQRKGKFGCINFKGEEVVPCEHKRPYWYEDEGTGKCIPMEKNGKTALIGMNGKLLTQYVYDAISIHWDITDQFSDTSNTTYFTVKQKGKKGLLSSSGKEIFPCMYSDIQIDYDSFDGNAIKLYQGKNYGMAAIDGKVIIPPLYKSITWGSFDQQLWYACYDGKTFRILNAGGIAVNTFYYDTIDWNGDENLALVKRNGQWFYLLPDGSETKYGE